jgi:DNA-binding NarL/FixJ family response regulator
MELLRQRNEITLTLRVLFSDRLLAITYARTRRKAPRSAALKEKISDVEHLAAALRAVSAGGSVIDSKVVERLVAARARGRSPAGGTAAGGPEGHCWAKLTPEQGALCQQRCQTTQVTLVGS